MTVKTPTTTEQIQRFEKLIETLKGLSPHEKRKHFDMGMFGQETDCGTTMCAAGFCGARKWFQDRGFEYLSRGKAREGTLKLGKARGWKAVCKFFGLPYSDWYDGGGEADRIFRDPNSVREVIAAAKDRIKYLRAQP